MIDLISNLTQSMQDTNISSSGDQPAFSYFMNDQSANLLAMQQGSTENSAGLENSVLEGSALTANNQLTTAEQLSLMERHSVFNGQITSENQTAENALLWYATNVMTTGASAEHNALLDASAFKETTNSISNQTQFNYGSINANGINQAHQAKGSHHLANLNNLVSFEQNNQLQKNEKNAKANQLNNFASSLATPIQEKNLTLTKSNHQSNSNESNSSNSSANSQVWLRDFISDPSELFKMVDLIRQNVFDSAITPTQINLNGKAIWQAKG